ncbi:MAG: hypothetical protein AAFU77_02745 [Myxococcota bacterium]
MTKTVALYGELELTDSLIDAACADGYQWEAVESEHFVFLRTAPGSHVSVAAKPYVPVEFSCWFPNTPIVKRSALYFFLDPRDYGDGVDQAIQSTGRVLQATDADFYMQVLDHDRPLIRYAGGLHLFRHPTDDSIWFPANLAAIPEPYSLHLYPSCDVGETFDVSGDFSLTEDLLTAVTATGGWQRGAFDEDDPDRIEFDHSSGATLFATDERPSVARPHELKGRTVNEKTWFSFSFDDGEMSDREAGRLASFKAAMRLVRATEGELLVRYRDLILMLRQAGKLTVFHTMPEGDLLDRPDYLAQVPDPYVWERLDPPWHADLPKIHKTLDEEPSGFS